MEYIPLAELPILVFMVIIRSAMHGRQGIKVMVFGATDKTDFLLFPILACFFYALLSPTFNLPFPALLLKPFWEISAVTICGAVICTASLVWFGITLKTFGKSFRVGIDENTKNTLITGGTFSISRNPVYVAFLAFFLGVFAAHPHIVSSVFLAFFAAAIHRQILREERFLKGHYGEEYREYCTKVRRYL